MTGVPHDSFSLNLPSSNISHFPFTVSVIFQCLSKYLDDPGTAPGFRVESPLASSMVVVQGEELA